MSKHSYIFIASMNIKKGYENLFNEVYDLEHIPYLLQVDGVNKVTRAKGMPFSFSIAEKIKAIDAPSQFFIAIYEIDNPEVVNSKEWSEAVEKGRWSSEVRKYTYERSHFMYKVC